MSPTDLDLNPVDHLTADALGPPGKRVFYLQGWQGERTVTLIIEKIQLQPSRGVEQFLAETRKVPDLAETAIRPKSACISTHRWTLVPGWRIGLANPSRT
jgi:hypothetical protein